VTWFVSDRRLNDQDERLKEQEEQQYAREVYIGEAPQAVRKYEDNAKWAVVNGGNLPIHGVWIAGQGGTVIKIDEVGGCEAYSTPPGFEAVGVNFKDINDVAWNRPVGKSLTQGYREPEGGFADFDDDDGTPGGPYPICAQ
jgi:hypothetical protein